ncbi:hypothetical protein LENED_002029 [Lentinula edodes]|uniref:Uncharacterized protein n=1 Tax=Lentinula edodes TaxID=5353 RepID=A0A1Q3E064_LENED|nr:hypothetical protein LENED_002029 [Lentinula edodes]
MSKNKRVKSHNAGGKRDTAVKDASKKKRKTHSRAIKFKNAELKATLDNQAHLLYHDGPINTTTNATSKASPIPRWGLFKSSS